MDIREIIDTLRQEHAGDTGPTLVNRAVEMARATDRLSADNPEREFGYKVTAALMIIAGERGAVEFH